MQLPACTDKLTMHEQWNKNANCLSLEFTAHMSPGLLKPWRQLSWTWELIVGPVQPEASNKTCMCCVYVLCVHGDLHRHCHHIFLSTSPSVEDPSSAANSTKSCGQQGSTFHPASLGTAMPFGFNKMDMGRRIRRWRQGSATRLKLSDLCRSGQWLEGRAPGNTLYTVLRSVKEDRWDIHLIHRQ